jgi:polyvinyl alcohol dehydrogenase (cytochrome)
VANDARLRDAGWKHAGSTFGRDVVSVQKQRARGGSRVKTQPLMQSRLMLWACAVALGSTAFAGCSDGDFKATRPAKAGPESAAEAGADDSDNAAGDGGSKSPSAATGTGKPSEPSSESKDAGAPEAPAKSDAGRTSGEPGADQPPCEVADVLKTHCVRCHGKTLREGAPIPLVDAADFQRDLGGLTIGAAAVRRVRDAARPMPPPPAARLTSDEVRILEDWVEGGAKAAKPGCSVDDEAPEKEPTDEPGVVVTRPKPRPEDDAGAEPADASVDAETELPDAGPTVEPTPSEWPTFGHDLANSRNNDLETTISKDNVGDLRELWRFSGPSTTAAPAVVGDVVYLPGWNGRVYALRLEDGSEVWTASLPDLIDSSPTVTETQVFVSDDNGSVHAIDRETGDVQWSRSVDSHEEAHLWSSPVYIASAGLIVVGVASGEEQVPKVAFTFRGSVVGLDAQSGEIRWRFETASAGSGSGPGIGSWGTAAVDESRKLVFIGTGNNYGPPSGEFSDSMLAINYESGELEWARQFTEGDVYAIYGSQGPDFDIGSSANLFSVDGEDFVGIGVKSGTYFALNRDTGEIVWRTSISLGSVLGGVISAPAYADGLIFVASNEFVASTSTAVAIDARSGDIVWREGYSGLTYGGVAHANGVVFMASVSGGIYAYDALSGNALWADRAPDGQPIAGSPTVASGRLIVPWGYQWTLREGTSGRGGMTVYGL